jgi:hypothetical protein
MSTLAMVIGGFGVFELLILAVVGIGMMAVLGLLVFISVKLAQKS